MESKEDLISKRVIQNMESILEKNAEFYWYIEYQGNIKLLSSGSDRNETEKNAINKILKMAKDREKLLKVRNKMEIFLFHLRKSKGDYEKRINPEGRLAFFYEPIKTRVSKIKDYDSSLSLKTTHVNKEYGISDIYWVDDKYLKKNNIINVNNIEKIIKFTGTGSPAAVRRLSDVIRDNPPKYLLDF